MRMRSSVLPPLFLSLAAFVLHPAAEAEAATFNVTTYDDVVDSTPDGICDPCSFRGAIQEANFLVGPDVINLPPGTYNMDIAGADEDDCLTGDLDITDDVTIIGIGTTRIESHVGRILHVHSGNVSITGLTLLQGDSNNDQGSGSAGGAVHNAAGSTLTLNLCTMTTNQAQGGGGAIFNAGNLSLNGSTLTSNSAVGTSRGGAVYNAGTMSVTNSTFDGNSSTDGGGAIYNGAAGILLLNNVTIAGNASTGGVGGGGIFAEASGTVTIGNTIIAGNNASGANDDCEAALTSLGSNLVQDDDGCTGLGAGDLTGADPNLGQLRNNGGRTFTRAPQAGSQALDTGGSDGACELTDQRGLVRPQGAACDEGAYEQFPACPAITVAPPTLPDGQDGVFYGQTIVPSGGVSPYRFAVTSGALPDGLALDPISGVLSGVPTKSGGNNFTISAFDANLCEGSLAYALNLLTGPSCSPTSITLSPSVLPEATPGFVYSQTLTATGGTAPHFYTVTDGSLPPSLTLDPNTGTISGTPSVSGTFVFVGTATDVDTCTGSQGYALQVKCSFSFSPTSFPDAVEETFYDQQLTIATGGTPPYAFAVVSGAVPPGLSLTGTGNLVGTPTAPGTYTFLVEATDANFCTGKIGYILVVDPCLSLSPASLPNGAVGTTYTATVTASGGSGPITYSISAGTLPPGLAIDPNTGTIAGPPATPGVYTFTVSATDGSCSIDQDYFIMINAAACPAVTISPTILPNDTEGNNYNQNLSGNGGSAPYTFQLVSGTLPTGVSLSAGGNLGGTLLAPGLFTFTVAATDSNLCSAAQTYMVIVAPVVCPTLGIFPPVLTSGSRGAAYAQTILATDGIPPYSYAITSGSLPPGLSLNGATGVLSGTPTTLGDFTFTVTATDATACTGSQAYTMSILPDLRGANCARYGDTFEDGVLATDWSFLKPTWTESNGNLVGNSSKKAIAVATPAFAGCLDCSIETSVTIARAGTSKVSLLGWYVDKATKMELSAAAGTDVWLLKQIYRGNVVAKVKVVKPIDTNVTYVVRIDFDGAKFDVYVDDMATPLMSLVPRKPVQVGTAGFQAKGTSASFAYICVQ